MANIDNLITKQYVERVAWPTIIYAFFCFILFIFCLIGVSINLIPLWLAFIANTILAYMAFTPFHEAAHGNIKGKNYSLRFLEVAIGYMMGLMLIGPFHSFAFIHLTHHAHTNQKGEDPDFWVHDKNGLITFFRCLTILFYYYWFFFTSKKRAAKAIFNISILAMLVFLLMMIGFAWHASFSALLFAWLIPSILANGLLAFVLDYLPHHPHNITERYKNSNVVYGKMIYFLSMAHSFHVVHHVWPKIPFYCYKQVFFQQKDLFIKQQTPIYDSLKNLILNPKSW